MHFHSILNIKLNFRCIVKLVDIVALVLVSQIVIGILYFGNFIAIFGFAYNDNLIKIVETNKKEYETITVFQSPLSNEL